MGPSRPLPRKTPLGSFQPAHLTPSPTFPPPQHSQDWRGVGYGVSLQELHTPTQGKDAKSIRNPTLGPRLGGGGLGRVPLYCWVLLLLLLWLSLFSPEI